MRYELADYEWTAIKPMLPNKPRGVPRVNDRRILKGIFWVASVNAFGDQMEEIARRSGRSNVIDAQPSASEVVQQIRR